MAEEPSAFDAFSAAYDKAAGDEPATVEPVEVVEAPADAAPVVLEEPKPESVVEEPKPAPEAPSYLPEEVKKHWGTMPEEVRDAISKSQRGMSDKLAETSRLVQGLGPIQNAVVQAAKEMPHLANMRPDQIAGEMLELAKISAQFNSKPVETLVGLIDKHNMRDAIRHVLGGNPDGAAAAAASAKELSDLRAEVARLSNPDFFRDQVAQINTQERAFEAVTTFMKDAEHWAAVEDRIPVLIPVVKAKLGETAPPAALLKEAYELAVSMFLPDKVKPVAAVEAAPVADPARAKAAVAAKAVNITGKVEGAPRKQSEREAFFEAYDRAARK